MLPLGKLFDEKNLFLYFFSTTYAARCAEFHIKNTWIRTIIIKDNFIIEFF